MMKKLLKSTGLSGILILPMVLVRQAANKKANLQSPFLFDKIRSLFILHTVAHKYFWS